MQKVRKLMMGALTALLLTTAACGGSNSGGNGSTGFPKTEEQAEARVTAIVKEVYDLAYAADAELAALKGLGVVLFEESELIAFSKEKLVSVLARLNKLKNINLRITKLNNELISIVEHFGEDSSEAYEVMSQAKSVNSSLANELGKIETMQAEVQYKLRMQGESAQSWSSAH